jgi:5'-nucleotidase
MAVTRTLVVIGLLARFAAAEVPVPLHVLLTNDDGIASPGLAAVAQALAADAGYRLTVVAPADEQSGKGTALDIREPVAVRSYPSLAGSPSWAVAATPATSARIGISAVLGDDPPQLVVSGINRGENIGLSAWYSGTVGAAREAVLAGVPALAFSLELDWADPRPDFVAAARWVKLVVDAVRGRPLPAGVYLNVNIPRDVAAIRGFRIARMGLAPPEVARYELVREEGGVRWFRSRWLPPIELEPGSDVRALELGWVSIVPLGLDHTHYPSLSLLEELELDPPASTVGGAEAARSER